MAKKHSIFNLGRQSRGSALLIAMMVMGILMTLSLGVSQILVTSLRQGSQFIDSTKAWYAAESGIEHSLYQISQHSPGFSVHKEIDEDFIKFTYKIIGASKKIPLKEDFEINYNEDSPASYARLGLNESVSIPLFAESENGETISTENFRVDFYVSPLLLERGGSIFKNLDILRWKVFGIANGGKNVGQMEVMNEFLPLEIEKTTANNPSCLGTSTACWNGAKFFQWNASNQEYDIVDPFPIVNFLRDHTQNFLVITNSVNTDLIADYSLTQKEKEDLAAISYRIVQDDSDADAKLALPFVKVTSDGFSRDIKQSLNVEVKRESFLPVFNYALYRTTDGE